MGIREAAFGAEHPDTLWSMNNLAGAYFSQGRHAEALYRETLEIRRRVLDGDDPFHEQPSPAAADPRAS